jgi:hypothetical protein
MHASFANSTSDNTRRDPVPACATITCRSDKDPTSLTEQDITRVFRTYGDIRQHLPSQKAGTFIVQFFDFRASQKAVEESGTVEINGEHIFTEFNLEAEERHVESQKRERPDPPDRHDRTYRPQNYAPPRYAPPYPPPSFPPQHAMYPPGYLPGYPPPPPPQAYPPSMAMPPQHPGFQIVPGQPPPYVPMYGYPPGVAPMPVAAPPGYQLQPPVFQQPGPAPGGVEPNHLFNLQQKFQRS